MKKPFIHLFHRWTTLLNDIADCEVTDIQGRKLVKNVVIKIEQCKVCSEKKASIEYDDGYIKEVNPKFVEHLIKTPKKRK